MPHPERTNTAAFLEETINHVLELQGRVRMLEERLAEKEKKKVSPTKISTDDDDSNTKKTKATGSEDVQPQKKAKKTTETKATDKSARKREKKIAWKKQQALKKAQRLKVKEAKGEA